MIVILVPKQHSIGDLNMNKTTLKFAFLSSALVFSASAMAVGLGVNAGAGVKAEVPGVSLNAGAKADAKADANADLKGKSSGAVKGAKSQGDAMRSEAGALHSEAKGDVGKRTGQLNSAADASANVNADVKASGKLKADKK